MLGGCQISERASRPGCPRTGQRGALFVVWPRYFRDWFGGTVIESPFVGGGARRRRAADGGPCWQQPTAEESPLSGSHGGGREPTEREREPRSRNDTARGHGEGDAPEDPSGYGETADSPGASPSDGRKKASRPSRKARSRMLPETERGLLPRPGRPGEQSPGCLPGAHS